MSAQQKRYILWYLPQNYSKSIIIANYLRISVQIFSISLKYPSLRQSIDIKTIARHKPGDRI